MDDPELHGNVTHAEQDDPDATVLADSDATQLAGTAAQDDAASVTLDVAQDETPTIVVPHAVSAGQEGPDGIDAMDDPYAPINDADFTRVTPYAPVAIDSPVTADGKHRSRVRPLAVIIVAVALLAAAAFVVKYTYENEYWGGKTVPDVVGKSETEARSTLSPLGFNITVNEALSDDNVGKVISMDPAAGTRTGEDLSVTITVAVARTVPSVVGQSLEDARGALLNEGAENITLAYQNSNQPEGTVLSVSPDEGQKFVSTDQITLTLAQPFKVPDVTGVSLSDAESAIKAAGLTYSVSYTAKTGEENVVLSTSPDAGTEVSEGSTVTLYVPTPKLTDAYHVAEYFNIKPADLDAYLAKQGYSVSSTGSFSNGDAYAVYTNGSATVTITDSPESSDAAGAGAGTNALAAGKPVGGVRLQAAASAVSSGASISVSGLSAVMDACGITNLVSSCTSDTAQTSRSIDKAGLSFICGYGEQDGYVWTVLIGSPNGSTAHVVVTIAPKSHYDGIDLSKYGNDLASYVALTSYYGK
ncbi:PASTA domain-containing protein [Olsenella sp. Marseille-P4559]|uniref:PASTA domain-containing protein n=1 Tax=Olsenella sp. Marseille-P4559 TaxID=2364795 RepID=UPI0013EF41BB|nr:PASTA domain-containing protein [Olsenella sp. Marseille-P4559]